MSAFAQRATVALLNMKQSLSGIAAVSDIDRFQRLNTIFTGKEDVSRKTAAGLAKIGKYPEDELMTLFWQEFGNQVTLPVAASRFTLHLPVGVKLQGVSDIREICQSWHPSVKMTSLSYLTLAPYQIFSPDNFADDIAIFDLKPTAAFPNPFDLSKISRFITVGTTISLYLPNERHSSWHSFARPIPVPPPFTIDNTRLEIIFSGSITADVYCVNYGVKGKSIPLTKT